MIKTSSDQLNIHEDILVKGFLERLFTQNSLRSLIKELIKTSCHNMPMLIVYIIHTSINKKIQVSNLDLESSI